MYRSTPFYAKKKKKKKEEDFVDEEGDLRRIVVQESPGAMAQQAGQLIVLSALEKDGSLKAGDSESVESEGG